MSPCLVEPTDPNVALARLRSELKPQAKHELESGWTKGFKSNSLVGLALKYLHAGRTLLEFMADVKANPQGAGAKYYGRSDQDRQYMLAFQRAVSYWKSGKPPKDSEIDRCIDKIQNAADCYLWPSRLLGLYVTLYGLLGIARKCGKTTIHASVRGLSDVTSLVNSSESRHLDRLVELGWLKLVEKASNGDAAIYSLGVPTVIKGHSHYTPPWIDRGVFHNDLALDAFKGKPGLLVFYSRIPPEGATYDELAKFNNKKRDACRLSVRRLRDLGLAHLKGRVVVAVRTEDALRDAARLRSTLGDTDRLRLLHESQRFAYHSTRRSG